MNFSSLLLTSRPRFWIYLLGPYLLGVAASGSWNTMVSATTILFAVFFTWPANVLVYGINDYFDADTDKLNEKKDGYETRLSSRDRANLRPVLAVVIPPFIVASAFTNLPALLAMVGFLFFSIFYSAPPIRAKTKPILDSFFNILYIFPALFGFYLVNNGTPALSALVAGGFWCMAMHAYSAVPDIHADTQAGLKTIATFLGARVTIVLCLILYLLAATLIYPLVGILAPALGSIYAALMLISLTRKNEQALMNVYRWFPIINTVVGGALFLWLVL